MPTLSNSMLAIAISSPGAPEVLTPAQRPMPIPSVGQVLIKVAAAGVNRPDVMQRLGLYPPPTGASDIPGLEIAGTIVALGAGVQHLHLGEQICTLVAGGGYAEFCLASADLCLPIPNTMTLIEAAALPETFFTVWSNVFNRAQLQANETLLVHGGSSGIGSTAIQLAKAFGAKVIVTAGSEAKCQFCLTLGANAAINYQTTDFVTAVQNFTQNNGVDVILDIVGGDYLPRNLKCMAYDARLLQIGLQGGVKAEVNLLPIMLKRLTITGSTLRSRNDQFKSTIAQQLLQSVWPLLAKQQIKPYIHSTFNLSDAVLAHRLMESNQHLGKIMLTVPQS